MLRQSAMQPLILSALMKVRQDNLGWHKRKTPDDLLQAKVFIKYRHKELRDELIKTRNASLLKRLRCPFE